MEELKRGQKDFLGRLDGLDQAVQERRAAASAAGRAQAAARIGLDVARGQKDLNAPEVQQQVEKDMADGRAADVQGTPTFFVNGKRVSNRSLEGFKQMIDEALKTKG